MSDGGAIDTQVDAWCNEDHARSLLPGDHEVVEATRTLRALILEGIAGALAERDLLHACWRLGHLTAARGGSPTLLGSTFDSAYQVTHPEVCGLAAADFQPEVCGLTAADFQPEVCGLAAADFQPAHERPWISMRAAAAEGFAAARLDLARAEAAAAWDYPLCAVRIDEECVALAGGYPDDDPAAIEAWAGRVAQRVARAGFRRAFVSGRVEVCRALEDALSLVGVVRAEERPARGLRALWKRSPKGK